MSRRTHLLVFGVVAACAALGGALAQDAQLDFGLDLEAIRARAAHQAAEAEALATTVRQRAAAVVGEAEQSAHGGEANGRRYTAAAKPGASSGDAFEFDALVAAAGDSARGALGDAPRFIAFASTSMPPASLKTMIRDVSRAGGVVVFRGLPQGSAKVFLAALARVLPPGEKRDGVGIDPRLFRAFAIDAVPTYVVAGSDFDLCDGFDCTTAVPPHDRLSGNVTPAFALRTFADGGGSGAQIAAQHLARLEERQP